jgi:tetratricopeptide (TPR) repeat protein/tRNA A-37 threonylcarbamoyl transferase component Bud32
MGAHPRPEQLQRWRDGLLEGPEHDTVEAHVQACADVCLPLLEQLTAETLAPTSQDEAPLPIAPGYDHLEWKCAGGMGVVYRARQISVDRVVALKMIRAGQLATASAVARFRTEAEAVGRLDHPNIVPIYEVGEHAGQHYFSMKFIDGGSLAEEAGRRGTPVGKAEFRWAAQIIATSARAVHHAHQRGILHRDLKPANILVDAAGQPHVTDFGLAKRLEVDTRLTQSGAIVGTPGYMAPEQARGEKGVSTAVDVYSLGAVLFAMLTGDAPFCGPTPLETVLQVLNRESPSPRSVNPAVDRDLETICLKCLEKDAERRYPSAEALAEDLDRWLHGEPIQARPVSRLERGWRWCRRKPAQAGLIGVATLLLLVTAVGAPVVALQEFDRRQTAEKLAQTERDAIEIEKQKTEAERLRAETERAAAHTARVTAARTLARRGDWTAALPEFDRAIRDQQADAVRLRVERVVGYFAVNDVPSLTGELDALGQEPLGDLAPQVTLLRGAWVLCDITRVAEGRALVEQALKRHELLFSPADVAFAEALASQRIGQAIRALRRAVEADPWHYLASSALAIALASVGDLAEARRQSRFLRSACPESAMPDLADAITALMDGDAPLLKAKHAALAARLPEERRADVARSEALLLSIIDLQKIGTRLINKEQSTPLDDLGRAVKVVFDFRKLHGIGNAEPLVLPSPIVGMLFQRLMDVATASLEIGRLFEKRGITPEAQARLEALYEDYPEGLLLTMATVARFVLAIHPVDRGDVEQARIHLTQASELAVRATAAPVCLPRSAVPYMARALGVMADVAILHLVAEPDPIHFRRLRDSLHPLVADGAQWPQARRVLLEQLSALIAIPLLREQCGDWKLDTPAGQAAFKTRMQEMAAQGRALLNDWEIDQPNSAPIAQLRTNLENWAASSGIIEPKKSAGSAR